jgi:hypothetical protein
MRRLPAGVRFTSGVAVRAAIVGPLKLNTT